jgi:hypothetical protein
VVAVLGVVPQLRALQIQVVAAVVVDSLPVKMVDQAW